MLLDYGIVLVNTYLDILW